jgi:tetratricopeptide (TPR) repeat protein
MAAGVETHLGDLERAAELYRQSIDLREEMLRANPNDIDLQRSLMVAYGNYAAILGIPWTPNLARPQEAREASLHSVRMARRLVSADAQNATARVDLGRSLTRLGSIDPPSGAVAESLASLQEAIGILETARVSNPKAVSTVVELTVAREYAGHRLESLGRSVEAAQQYKAALAIAEPLLSSGNPSILAGVLANEEALALLDATSGNRGAALDYANRALTLAEKPTSGSADNSKGRVGKALYVLAFVQMKSNDRALAHENASKAAAMWRTIESKGLLSVYRKEVQETGTLLNETAGAVRR